MKINEVVQSLEESFRDLKTVLSGEIDAHDGDISITLRRMAQRSSELSEVVSGVPRVSADAAGMLQLIRSVVRHPLLPENLQQYRDTGTWIRMIKERESKLWWEPFSVDC